MTSPDQEQAVENDDVVARLAVIGRHTMFPSIKPVDIDGREVLVGHAYSEKVIDEGHGLEIDVSDCTVFTVTHVGYGQHFDVENAGHALALLDDSLRAISEVVLWERAHERVGKSSPFQRRVGRIDVKFFSIDGDQASDVMWRNPMYFADLSGLSMMSGFLSNMIMRNGPSANPLPPDVKRVMSSIDLVNLGFFTEAFVSAFSLLDDMTQRVVAGGLEAKGFTDREQKDFLRAIKEQRLDTFLNRVMKLCDWKSLEERNSELNAAVGKVNTLRNNVMHGDRELTRSESLWAIDVVVTAIAYLRENPFGVEITGFPPLRPAEPELVRMPDPTFPGSETEEHNEDADDEAPQP